MVDYCLSCMYKEKYLFFNFFYWTSELHISQAFWEHQAPPIPTPSEPMVKFRSKRILSSFFLYFLRSSYMQPCGKNCPRTKGQGAKKEVYFAHRILVFHFFYSWFCMMSPSMWLLQSKREVFIFFKKFYKVHNVELLTQDPHQQKEF
jgi:hypothetical protein